MKFESAVFETSFGTPNQLTPSTLPEIAFSGRSNVGKSSLLNKILGRKNLARVSSVPGKTVTINFFKLDTVRFVDLPGYGFAKVNNKEKQRWSSLMETYFDSGRDIKLVCQLVDMRHGPSEMDLQMMDYMSYHGIPFVVVATKSDKLNKTEYSKQKQAISETLERFGNVQMIPFSALKGEGVSELREIIKKSV